MHGPRQAAQFEHVLLNRPRARKSLNQIEVKKFYYNLATINPILQLINQKCGHDRIYSRRASYHYRATRCRAF
jgi:hypothetical protein